MTFALASLGAASPYARASAAGLGPFAAKALVRVTPGEAIASVGPLQPVEPAAKVEGAEARGASADEPPPAPETVPVAPAPSAGAVARSLIDGLDLEPRVDRNAAPDAAPDEARPDAGASFARSRLAAARTDDPAAPAPGLAPRLFDYGVPTSSPAGAVDLAA